MLKPLERKSINAARSEGAPASMLPGSQTQSFFKLKPRPHTSKITGFLPTLTSTEEKESIAKMRPLFKTFLESVSDFISHNGSTPKIRNKLQQVLTDVDRYFTGFFRHLSKSGGTTISISKLQSTTSTPMIKNTAMPFIKSWGVMMNEIDDVLKNGIDMIHDSVESNFNTILTILEAIQKGLGYNAGVHDIVLKKSKKFQQQIWTFQGAIAKFLGNNATQKAVLEDRIVADLKSFSRDLSSAFSTEFSSVAVTFPDNEKNRNTSYNCICEVIYEMKAAVLFDADTKKIADSIEPLSGTIKIIATNLNIANLLVPAEPEAVKASATNGDLSKASSRKVQKEETNEKETFFSRDLELTDLIDRGFIVFKRSGVSQDRTKEFFDSLRYKIAALESTVENQKKEIFQKNQQITFNESFKDRLTQETQKVATLRGSTNQLQDKITSLEAELDNMRKHENILGLRECLKKCNELFSKNAGVEEKECKNDMSLISSVNELLCNSDATSCKKCKDNELVFSKLEKLLGSQLFVEETQVLVKNHSFLQKSFDKLKKEKDALLREKAELTSSVLKILEMFNVTPPAMVPLEVFCIQSVQEQIAILEHKYEVEKANHDADIARISQKIETLFQIHKMSSVEKQLEQLKAIRESDIGAVSQYKAFLESVETRLCAHLKTKKSGHSMFESIKLLLSQVETNTNPLQVTVDTLQSTINSASESLKDTESTVHRLTKTKADNEERTLRLDERISALNQLLRAYE